MFVSLGRPEAIAVMGGAVFGSVKFYPLSQGVLVVADVGGLPQSKTGIFALHIHDGASCEGEDFSGSRTHYNPERMPHPSHAGDLPPLFSVGGTAFLAVRTDRFSISEIIGKTVVIHSNPDDFSTQPSGNSGRKIACGVIQMI